MPESEQGATCKRYLVNPRVLIFITRGDSVLLLKGSPSKRLWNNMYNGVGGHVEQGEDILSAARRELFEETSLHTRLSLCGTLMVDTGAGIGVGLFIFTGECMDEEPVGSEEGTLEWIPFGEIDNKPLVEDVAILISRIRLKQPGAEPFSGRSYYNSEGHLEVEFMD